MLNDIGINENLANSLYTDLELNKTELERLIKSNMNDKLNNLIVEPEPSGQRNTPIQKNNSTSNINHIQENYNSQNNEQIPVENYQKNINQTNTNSNPSLNLSRFVELKSHFDVVRKLGYLPNLNSLISISEVN
jgi:hypothetical protein